jgi:hypothetical protein
MGGAKPDESGRLLTFLGDKVIRSYWHPERCVLPRLRRFGRCVDCLGCRFVTETLQGSSPRLLLYPNACYSMHTYVINHGFSPKYVKFTMLFSLTSENIVVAQMCTDNYTMLNSIYKKLMHTLLYLSLSLSPDPHISHACPP